MEQTAIEQLAEQRGAKFAPRSQPNMQADFYTALPGKPRKDWKRVGMTSAGADIKRGKFPPCPLGECSGNGIVLVEDTGRGRKSYKMCACTKREA